MLTRLKVNGFKNLVDVDVRFGPFTCIAGVNGSGKSNLFDAIRFLAALAEKPLVEAALSIRGGSRSSDIRDLFHRVGDRYAEEMSFEAEMIVPAEGRDDLGMAVKADDTYVRYALTLTYVANGRIFTKDDNPELFKEPGLRIVEEQLTALSTQAAREDLGFAADTEWFESAVCGGPGKPIISTERGHEPGSRGEVVLHYDEPQERALRRRTIDLPRTVLSRVEGDQSPTAVMVQQEMRSWRALQLDPAAIRKPDDVAAPTTVGSNGAHVASTLYRVAHEPHADGRDPYEAETAVYARVANRIWRLVGDIWDLTVEPDTKREALTVYVTDRNGTRHTARALSDGTLRFLALAVIEEEQKPGLLCIEEPENGVHPARIESLLKLLLAIAMDTRFPIEEGNPLRQVIISTHSPSVVLRVPEDSLVVAELRDTIRDRGRFKRAYFCGLANTWRDPVPNRLSLPIGALLTYLNPEGYRSLPPSDPERDPEDPPSILDRSDVQRMLSPRLFS